MKKQQVRISINNNNINRNNIFDLQSISDITKRRVPDRKDRAKVEGKDGAFESHLFHQTYFQQHGITRRRIKRPKVLIII
jgi:hypothetical protein